MLPISGLDVFVDIQMLAGSQHSLAEGYKKSMRLYDPKFANCRLPCKLTSSRAMLVTLASLATPYLLSKASRNHGRKHQALRGRMCTVGSSGFSHLYTSKVRRLHGQRCNKVSKTAQRIEDELMCQSQRRSVTLAGVMALSPLSWSRPCMGESVKSSGSPWMVAEPAGSDGEAQKIRRMLGDPEVEKIRQLQAEAKLFDMRRGIEMRLVDLLRPGELLFDADVVCVGELHTSEQDHAMQRLLVDALTYALFLQLRESEGIDPAEPWGRTPQNLSPQRVAIGVEYFTRQQQTTLDELIFDRTPNGPGSSPSLFRKATNWDQVWSYDWDIYAPLFRFCQLNLNRIVGLNLPLEAVEMVSRGGVEATPEWLRNTLPQLDLAQKKHRRRFEDMLQMPIEDAVARMSLPSAFWEPRKDLNGMYQAQVLWDEVMADSALKYIDGAGGRMVLLAGDNHCWRDAIPDRFERQSGQQRRAASVMPWRGKELPPTGMADYVWQMHGPGGGDELAAQLAEQRKRLKGQSRVFPAGYI
eukprot:TRINITY_DN77285_c0_g1_i1.p1 TRINITY_DN77285_c0_g1~~TRINITY_DN77285_c0_g1_i1.p1  ORF type:complete len:526 (+),score=76.87 TRINITY_DN77285_c0_g1_i1:42-1619(+)